VHHHKGHQKSIAESRIATCGSLVDVLITEQQWVRKKFCETPAPTNKDLERFRDHLFDELLGLSTINNYSFAVEHYCEMLGDNFVSTQFLQD
jgi:hypothetical protein